MSRLEKIGAPEPIAALNRVFIREYTQAWPEREPLVDIRTHCPEVVISEHVCPYLRQTVADMVNAAAHTLPPPFRLRAGSAMRTLAMQQHGWDNYHKKLREEHPTWPLSALRRATNKFFAPYDQKAPPGHCTGGAVDVGLLDADGASVDLTSPTQGWEAAYTWSDKLSPEAKANRMLMVEAMLGAGFSNCRDEYWHYSYGDSAWAVRVGEASCPYGWTYPPVVLEANFADASASALQMDIARDASGRVLRAEGVCAVPDDAVSTLEGLPRFAVGLYWARGISTTLRLQLPPNAPSSFLVYQGEQRDKPDGWRTVSAPERQGDTLILTLTPDSDRLYLANALPVAPPPNETAQSAVPLEPPLAEDEPGALDATFAKPDD